MKKIQVTLITIFLLFVLTPFFFVSAEEEPAYHPIPNVGKMRLPPRQRIEEAHVVVQWSELVDECPVEKICIQGEVVNDGKSTAHNVRLRVDIGATKLTKPRTSFIKKLDEEMMQPGDHQDFSLEIDRKITVKEKDKTKMIEVGKFNFQVNPIWLEQKQKNKR